MADFPKNPALLFWAFSQIPKGDFLVELKSENTSLAAAVGCGQHGHPKVP